MVKPIKPSKQKTYQLGLFGHPVKHSQSPLIHAEYAKQFGIKLDYQLLDVTTTELPDKFKQWINTAHGCNVTVPHKNNIIPLLDHYTERARLAQAVNTVFWQDNELWGDNTDGDGLVLDLESKNITLKDALVLLIGAGGAAQGIIPSLLNQNIQGIELKNRNREKANKMAAQFNSDQVCVAGLKMPCPYDLIIHATSMGHQGLCPELKNDWFHNKTVAYDLSYGEVAEPFLSAVRAHGVKQAYDGIGMLHRQAALAFQLWFDKYPLT